MARVLVVDDSSQYRDIIRTVVEGAGHTVVEASEGPQAISLISKDNFDCIVTDIILPVGDGLSIIEYAIQNSPQARVLAISGGSQSLPAAIALIASRAHGAVAVLYKPFRIAELARKIEELLSRT